jgi:hypothetical protein
MDKLGKSIPLRTHWNDRVIRGCRSHQRAKVFRSEATVWRSMMLWERSCPMKGV